MKNVVIGIIGFGTVGQGVVEVLEKNAREIQLRTGYTIRVKSVARRQWPADQSYPFHCTTRPEDIVNDPDINIVIELAGGEEPARTLIAAALEQGKHVITANKALIAKHGEALFALARERGVGLEFEAAVAGGIPVIKVLREGMTANEIIEVAGIINGTDAGHKITILASLAFGIPLQFDQIYIEGIEALTPEDIRTAADLGYGIKHLALALRRPEGVEIRVHPTLIPREALLCSVNGVMNAVQVKGNAIGTSLYYGAGAGRLPTASAVVADLIDVIRELNLSREDRLAEFGYQKIRDREALPVLDSSQFISAYYLRLTVADRAGVLAEIARIMATHDISLQSVVQKNAEKQGDSVPLILLTERVVESKINAALAEISTLDALRGAVQRIRVAHIG